MKNIHGGMLILLKMQTEAANRRTLFLMERDNSSKHPSKMPLVSIFSKVAS